MPISFTGKIAFWAQAQYGGRRTFSATYAQDTGWTPDDAPVIEALRFWITEAGPALIVNHPIPTEPREIPPTLDGPEDQVANTLGALAKFVTDRFRIESSPPLGEATELDPDPELDPELIY